MGAGHRQGMLLNVSELASIAHPPSQAVQNEKLLREVVKTKAAPAVATGHALHLGQNVHRGATKDVSLNAEQHGQHAYVVGASGTGKSTLLCNMVLQDMAQGHGVAVLDPHGDLVDQLLGLIPEERMKDVVLFDPADADFPVGFNILSAHSELEKTLLASDLVAVFRRLATSWGDQMNAVLANAVLAILESSQGGTLLDLRRLLVEPKFRKEFLETVADPEVVYYWKKVFPTLQRSPQASILTRLDVFLRPKLVRNVVVQRRNALDVASVMGEGKILLAKLSQGAIGEENSYLLGTLLVSKFHQIAMSRQAQKDEHRRPFFLYIDEFHNFVTPTMAHILAAARKYRLGLVLAHQELRQLLVRDAETADAVLTNPYTRICFRVGEQDAKKLAEGFAGFEARDLTTLGRGEALCRIERADGDFNLRTDPPPAVDPAQAEERRNAIVQASREKYATPRAEVEAELAKSIGDPGKTPYRSREIEPDIKPPTPAPTPPEPPREEVAPLSQLEPPAEPTEAPQAPPEASTPPKPPPSPGRGGQEHKRLQRRIKEQAEGYGWGALIEAQIPNRKSRVDVLLKRENLSIACEVCITSPTKAEVKNIQKCLAAGYDHVVSVAPNRATLRKVERAAHDVLDNAELHRTRFLTFDELLHFLAELGAQEASSVTTHKGWRVKVKYKPVAATDAVERRRRLAEVLAESEIQSDKNDSEE